MTTRLPRECGLDDVLLNLRQLLERNLYAEVAAGNHYAVDFVQNLLNIVDAFHILDLADDLDIFLAVFAEDFLDVADILRAAGERCCDEVNALCQTEFDVCAILLGNEGHVQLDARHVDRLAVGKGTAVERLADNIRALDRSYLECNQTVVDEDAGADLNIVRQAVIGDRNDGVVALNVAGGQGELLSSTISILPSL